MLCISHIPWLWCELSKCRRFMKNTQHTTQWMLDLQEMLCVSDTRLNHYFDLYSIETLTFDILSLRNDCIDSYSHFMIVVSWTDDVLCLRIIILIQCTEHEFSFNSLIQLILCRMFRLGICWKKWRNLFESTSSLGRKLFLPCTNI